MKKLMFSLLMCCSLAGCTTQWVPATSNPPPLNEAMAECQSSASNLFPVKNEVAQRSTLKSVRQPCSNDDKCGKEGYYYQNVPMYESYVIDVNEDSRREFYRNCMLQKGWKQQTRSLL
ncbi:hypothetical protein [Xenorhabdus sp. IM139775]|uniref:hypothetical protein n=1 Tax=Xenorhabdus sp. IM139775 TaxID=3025876 RepID=UPI0023587FC5|nr:hypothetical protein [Xenorhabdus sp. IM139775]MDC9593238.1 hypothetical protein [Xenorhabdus sp. IM139775]